MRILQENLLAAVTEANRLSAGSRDRLLRLETIPNALRVSADNDGVIVVLDVPANTEENAIDVTLSGPTLAQLLQTYPPHTFTLSMDKVERQQKRGNDFVTVALDALSIRMGDSRSRLISQIQNPIKAMPNGKHISTIYDVASFRIATAFASNFAVWEKNSPRPILEGVRITSRPDALQFLAADGYTLGMSTAPNVTIANECNILIHVKHLDALCRVAQNLDSFDIFETPDHGLILKTNYSAFYVPGIDGKFPPVEHLFLTNTFNYTIDAAAWVKPVKSLKPYNEGIDLVSSDYTGLTIRAFSQEKGDTELPVSTQTAAHDLRNFSVRYSKNNLSTVINALNSAYTSHPRHTVKQGRKTVKLSECLASLHWSAIDSPHDKPLQFAANVYGIELKVLIMPMTDRETTEPTFDQKVNAEYIKQGIEHGIAQQDYNDWKANTLPTLIQQYRAQQAARTLDTRYDSPDAAEQIARYIADYRALDQTFSPASRDNIQRIIDRLCNGAYSPEYKTVIRTAPRRKIRGGPHQGQYR